MRRIPTCLVLILSSFQAPAQLLPTRSIGVFGYQTLEPLGFNSSYSGIVDEWGSLPLPVMNLALNNCGINKRIWRPTRSVLDGHYLLTGQVEIENIAKKSRDSTGHDSDSTHFSLLGNSSSLAGVQLESSGARDSFTWQVSGHAGSQRFQPLWGEFAPWGQPDYDVLGLYAAAGSEVTDRIRISGRVAMNSSASLYTHLDHQAKQELYGSDSLRPLGYLIDSVVPPSYIYDVLIIELLPIDEPIPFEAVAQKEQSIHAALKLEFQAPKGVWRLTVNAIKSRWHQRITQQHADVRLPFGLPNSSFMLTRETKHQAGWERFALGFRSTLRETDLEFFSGVRRQYPELSGPPLVRDASNQRITLGAEVYRRRERFEITASGKLSATSKFGLRPAALVNFEFSPKRELVGFVSIGHDWREPSPFEHQWKSMLNADALNSQSDDGIVMFLYDNLQCERATFAQVGLRYDLGKHPRSQFEITAPIALIHRQWNVDHQGVIYSPFNSPPIYWNWPGYSGILLSSERGVLSGFTAKGSLYASKGLSVGANYTLSSSLQSKGGVLNPEYLTPRNRFHIQIGFDKISQKGRGVKLNVLAERIGPQWISVDHRPALSLWSMGMGPLVVENEFSDPFVSTRIDIELRMSRAFGVRFDLTHHFIPWETNPVQWSHDVVYTPAAGPEQRLIGPLDANFSTAYAPLVPTTFGMHMKYQF